MEPSSPIVQHREFLSMFSCGHSSPIENPETMSKRLMQERNTGEERVMATSKRTMSEIGLRRWIRVYHAARGITKMLCVYSDRSGIGKPKVQNVKDASENAASSSQVWHLNENIRNGIEKSTAKADQRSVIGKPIAQIQNRLTETRFDPSQLPDLRLPIPQESVCESTTKTESS